MDKKSINPTSGSAIIIILVTIALFGALSWAWSQSNRSSTGWLMAEQTKAAATTSTQCQNNINAATKRLEARGCGTFISTNTNGALAGTAGEPSDGSCALYHPNGGGIKPCTVVATAPDEPCGPSPTIGQTCTDGSIYAGLSPDGNEPMFVSDVSFEIYTTGGPGVNNGVPYCITSEASCETGEQNTAMLALNPGNLHATHCANLVAHGHNDWYLPARDETLLLATLQQNGFASLQNVYYLTSSESTQDHNWLVLMFNSSTFDSGFKPNSDYVRCVRKSD